MRRNYRNTSVYLLSDYSIELHGSAGQVLRMSAWLDQILQVPIGRETLDAVFASGNELLIRHSSWALHAAGRTLAPMTRNLTNKRGADVEIMFDARIPDGGSHRVYDKSYQSIEYTAVQNLFHELAHAKHLTNGTWRYFDSEGQAIEEENRFRAEYAKMLGKEKSAMRSGIKGEQHWWPETASKE